MTTLTLPSLQILLARMSIGTGCRANQTSLRLENTE